MSGLSVEVAIRRAFEIHRLLERSARTVQVRFYRGELITFRFPVPRGYGVRGELIATYSSGVPVEWIRADFVEFVEGLTPTARACETSTPDFVCSV